MGTSDPTKASNLTPEPEGCCHPVASNGCGIDFEKFAAILTWGYNLDRSGYQDAADSIYADTISTLETECLNSTSPKAIRLFAEFSKTHGERLLALGRVDWSVSAFRRALNLYQLLISNCASFSIAHDFSTTLLRLAQVFEAANQEEQALEVYREAAVTIKTLIPLAQTLGIKKELELEFEQATVRSVQLRESLA